MEPIDVEKVKAHQLATSPDNTDNAQITLLAGTRLALVFGAFLISFALVALDQTILATALPKIASHFNAVSELSWVASAYFLPQAAFMLFFGSVLSIAPAKPIFLFSIMVFEIGSLLCAVAPSVSVLILGRAVSGFGASGLWVSIMSTIGRVTTMAQRPILMGLFGALFAVASIVGPLIGGAFADHVTWRWCFYINLPLGPISMLAVFYFLPPQPSLVQGNSQWQRWLHLDWWGGNTKPWSDPGVIVCLVLFALLLIAFVAWEHKKGSDAILPLKMLLRKNILGAFIASAFIQLAFVIAVYYLPLLYQVRGHSATKSGIDILPFMISGVITTMLAGSVVSVKGIAWPFLLFFPLIASIGFGLLFTTNLDSTTARLLGYQILIGVGLGAAVQNTLTRYAPELSQQATIAVLSSVEAMFTLPPEQITSVQQAYTAAIDKVMIAGVPFATLASVSAILISREQRPQTSTGGG
ncbi:hypothetical protein DXG01_014797 [Tephrocybe rancida]|nr:hypothetical protein DXG01_014797 [Tephrocybe rancida]